ncbi:hypothetical protein L596_009454 [Steinernema carpocapsae]|uniref:Uncharacterized protein n=1 Tax=Steinernema carpocapsae TaxID=34508 RepID=A0A4U5PFX4_STECR|nr:hypothetical protein L596_009454 [Steinernema carpocapsae]
MPGRFFMSPGKRLISRPHRLPSELRPAIPQHLFCFPERFPQISCFLCCCCCFCCCRSSRSPLLRPRFGLGKPARAR